jgi:acetylglutamate kinase
LLVARKRPPVETEAGTVDFGAVGDPVAVDPVPLRALLDAGRLPVVSPPASDGLGGLLNVNADFMAAAIASALGAAKLVLVTGAPGILTNPEDPRSLVSALSLAELAELEGSGRVRGGMKAKSTAIRRALDGGVGRVHVVSGLDPGALLIELYTNHGAGTLVTRERELVPEEEPVESHA